MNRNHHLAAFEDAAYEIAYLAVRLMQAENQRPGMTFQDTSSTPNQSHIQRAFNLTRACQEYLDKVRGGE